MKKEYTDWHRMFGLLLMDFFTGSLLPEAMFRLFAVSARYPRELARQVPWVELQQGVYECRRGTDVFRILVAGELPQSANNALLHLFSASTEQWGYGTRHYRQRSADTSTLIY